jgi:hypothetical protein
MEDTRLDVTPIVQQASPVTESHFFGSGGILAWKKFPQFRAVRWFAAAALAVGLSAIVTVVSLELLRNKGYLSANQPAPVSSKVASPTQTVSTAAEPKAAAPSPHLRDKWQAP